MQPTTDFIIIGSGVGGPSCGALLGRYGFQVTICESHSIPGGVAHSFQRDGYIFDRFTFILRVTNLTVSGKDWIASAKSTPAKSNGGQG